MDIQIKDQSAALATCEELAKQANAMNGDITTLEGHLSKIKEVWASNGVDKESYVVELDKQIRNFRTICDAIRKLASAIRNYVETANQISNLSVGDSIAGHSVTVGYTNAGNAVNGVNQLNLNTNCVNDKSSIRGFAIVGENGNLVATSYDAGMSIEEFAKANNVSVDRVAVDVGQNGVGQAWVPASTFK